MEYGVPQGSLSGLEFFIIYTLTPELSLNYYNVSYHFRADNAQIYFKLDRKDHCVYKLNTVLNDVRRWLSKRKFKFIKDKTNILVVGNSQQIIKIDIPLNLNRQN